MLDSDRELLSRIAMDDVQAFQKLYHKYWDPMVKQSYAHLQDMSASEDLVQDIFLYVWNKRKSIAIQSSVKAYLLTAVKYQVYRIIDQRRNSFGIESVDHLKEQESQSDVLSFEEVYSRIEVVIEKLPPRQREIFKLSRFGQMSTKEIADKLHLAPQTVNNKIHQSLNFLKAELKHFIFSTWFMLVFFAF